MPKQLTDTLIRAAKPPERGQVTITDATLPNFGIRMSQGGSKSFIVMLGQGRRQTIGHYPLISLADARREARRILAEKELGRVRPAFTAFDDAKAQFLTDCETRNRPRTVKDYTRLLRHLNFGRQALPDIQPREIIRKLDQLKRVPSERHHTFVASRGFFRWCVRQHLIDRSPMENMEVPSNGRSRERMLAEHELKALLEVTATRTTFHAIVRLLILTGARRGEMAALEWSWIDDQERTITLPSTITKNRRTHTFPYGDLAAAVFAGIPRIEKCPYVFPAARQRTEKTTTFNGWGKPKAALDAQINLAPWTLHDLRRTYSSTMAALGVPQIVVEKLLNHVSGGTQSPIAQTYNRYSYLSEMRDAILKYEAYLAMLVSPRA